jgi:hypothetical protein
MLVVYPTALSPVKESRVDTHEYWTDDADYQGSAYIVMKARFKALETNTFGVLLAFVNEELRMVENLMAIASHYSSLYDIDPHLPWYVLEEDIINLKWKGDIAVNISVDLQNYLESSLEGDRGNELYQLLKNNDLARLDSLLQSILMKPLADRNIALETVTEITSEESMRSARAGRDKKAAAQREEGAGASSKKDENYLDLDPVLAPVSGIPIYELSAGDRIMVRISDRTNRGRYYIDLLGARVNGNVIPVPAEVTHIERREGEYIILCRIGEKAMGRIVETEQVKIKHQEEGDADAALREIPLDEVPRLFSGFPLFVVVTGGLMFIVLLLFIIMWFYNVI